MFSIISLLDFWKFQRELAVEHRGSAGCYLIHCCPCHTTVNELLQAPSRPWALTLVLITVLGTLTSFNTGLFTVQEKCKALLRLSISIWKENGINYVLLKWKS